MEADSTTYESSSKALLSETSLPFSVNPRNFKIYKDFFIDTGKRLECQIVEKLQSFGLLPDIVRCPSGKPECRVVCKPARVIDRVQWVCEGCDKRQPIRIGSFFFRLQCSLVQTLQMILAWCEDADCEVAAQHFGVKPKVANTIYDRLDDLAIKEHFKYKLGGENGVVLAEIYPDCLNRLSPDTTDQPHVHQILMLADTNHIPTHYWLHVIKDDSKKVCHNVSMNNQALKSEIENVVSKVTVPNSIVVTGYNVPVIDGASSIQQLVQHCDVDMQHFLSSRIWRQAVSLCGASRELCAGAAPREQCARAAQRYLHAALHRLRCGGSFEHALAAIADEFTEKRGVFEPSNTETNVETDDITDVQVERPLNIK